MAILGSAAEAKPEIRRTPAGGNGVTGREQNICLICRICIRQEPNLCRRPLQKASSKSLKNQTLKKELKSLEKLLPKAPKRTPMEAQIR